MSPLSWIALLWLGVVSGCLPEPEPAPEGTELAFGPLPEASFYHLDLEAEDAQGRAVGLDLHRGHPVLVTLFYASCPSACPMLIQDLQAFEASLTPEARDDLRVVLVTLDPERDDPAALAEVSERFELDPARWSLLRTRPDQVRVVAAALGVRYRPAPNGEMNHASLLTLLDRDGVSVGRLEGLRRDATPLREALRAVREPVRSPHP